MIKFSYDLGWWSPAVFWYVLIGVLSCLAFTLVVFIFGAGDMVYLLKSMNDRTEEEHESGGDDK